MATKTEVLRHKIAREVFGEVDDGDGIREYPTWEIFEKCLEQHKQIKDLEHRLSNCIEPKFKIGQEVWFVSLTDNICSFVIEDLQFTLCGDGKSAMCYYDKNNVEHFEFNLFATEEEAKIHLKNLQEK